MPEPAPIDIAHIISLSVAPVFLIAGIGAFLNVMTSRLARVVDRGRLLEAALHEKPTEEMRERLVVELIAIHKRMSRINIAISLCTLAALFVCLVIMFLFTGQLLGMDLSRIVSVMFVATMAALILALVFFLGEISVAIRTLRIRRELLVELRKP